MFQKQIALCLCILGILRTFAGCTGGAGEEQLTFKLHANGSSGEHWSYTLSCEGVLEEKSYSQSRSPLNFGPGYEEVWVFEPVGEGEVTIFWTAYEGGNDVVTDKCFSVTYAVDSEGVCTLLEKQTET